MKECFVICPLGDEGSAVRQTADRLLKYVISPVLERNGFDAIRADQIPEVGLITSQIIKLLTACPLVIADLTGSNPNVFYELAIRHASGRPFIQMVTKGEKIPFDISGIRTIEFDLQDLDNVEKTKNVIEKQIRAIERGHVPESPVSVAAGAKLLQDDEEFAERIAGNINMLMEQWNSYNQDTFSFADEDINSMIKTIHNKLWSLTEYGAVSLEDISKKLDRLLEDRGTSM